MDRNPDVTALVARLAERGISFRVRKNRLWVWPERVYRDLSEEDRALIGQYRQELKALALHSDFVAVDADTNPLPAPPPPPPPPAPVEPTPEVYAYGHRVTESDVLLALEMLGDDAVANYHAGRMSKRDAYDIARRRLREFAQLRSAWRWA